MKRSADGSSCSTKRSQRATLSTADVISAIESSDDEDLALSDYHDSDIVSDTDDMIESSTSGGSENEDDNEP